MLELTIRLIVSLAIVVGLLLLLARISSRRFGSQKGALVQVVHRQPLSRTSAVSVVSVGSRVLVLGTTEHKISVLAELDPGELEDELTGEATVLELVGDELVGDELAPAEVAALLGTEVAEIPVETTTRPRSGAVDVRRPAGHRRAGHRASPRRATPSDRPTGGALSGSVLSPQTWRQALAAIGRRAS